jgi:hypothetical protein
MLVAVLFWTAIPAFACLSSKGLHARGGCCAAMTEDCSASMAGSCCQLAPKDKPSTVTSVYAPESNQQPGIAGQTSFLATFTNSGTVHRVLRSLPARDPSPGLLSVLRI